MAARSLPLSPLGGHSGGASSQSLTLAVVSFSWASRGFKPSCRQRSKSKFKCCAEDNCAISLSPSMRPCSMRPCAHARHTYFTIGKFFLRIFIFISARVEELQVRRVKGIRVFEFFHTLIVDHLQALGGFWEREGKCHSGTSMSPWSFHQQGLIARRLSASSPASSSEP